MPRNISLRRNGLKSPKVEFRHLRYFLAVAEERSFSRAAVGLGIAQPPLSQQIKRLEELVGQRLLERRPEVRLTAAGESLAASARKLISQLDHNLGEAERAGRGYSGTLTIGFPASAVVTWFPQAIRRFGELYPDVTLRLKEFSSAEQASALGRGAIDVGFLRGAISDGEIHCEPVLEEPFMAVLPNAHRLSRRRTLDLNELADDKFIMFPRSVAPALWDEVSAIFRRASVTRIS